MKFGCVKRAATSACRISQAIRGEMQEVRWVRRIRSQAKYGMNRRKADIAGRIVRDGGMGCVVRDRRGAEGRGGEVKDLLVGRCSGVHQDHPEARDAEGMLAGVRHVPLERHELKGGGGRGRRGDWASG